MIDIVFPYINGEDQFSELKYAIRSIEKYFKDDFRIVLVGDIPPWIKPTSILFISHIRHIGTFSKVEDSVNKMNVIINHPQISDPFLYWYDDIYLLNPVSVDFFKNNNLAYSKYSSIPKMLNSYYRICMWNTFDELKKYYPKEMIYNYETHLPKLFFKSKMKEIIKKYNPYENKLHINTLYYQEYSANTVIINKNDNIKAGFYGEETDSSFGHHLSEKEILEVLDKKIFLNHDDAGLTQLLQNIICKKFNLKSICEQ